VTALATPVRRDGESSDAELVARCLDGDQAAWDQIVQRMSRYVYAICKQAYRLSHHDAEDVFQETYLRLYQNLPSLRTPDALRPWVGQVTRRLCLDRLRSSRPEMPSDNLDLYGVDDSLDQIHESLAIREAMARLPESSQQILDRFFCQDESYRTIGEALDIPAGTIASRISRALVQLKSVLDDEHWEHS
jgi:RNA polymerase sigma factor (sigma-70 family)